MDKIEETTYDDMVVLKDLLQHIRGISPVAGSAMELGFVADDSQ